MSLPRLGPPRATQSATQSIIRASGTRGLPKSFWEAVVSTIHALGASAPRILFQHILPNSVSIIVTFIPFSVAAGVTALTALDYLGFGLPPPTPSWGELLAQGTANLQYPWIVTSVVVAMTAILLMVAFVGEAIREAFDPKQFTYYE